MQPHRLERAYDRHVVERAVSAIREAHFPADQQAVQDRLHLHRGEMHPEAHMAALAERNEGERLLRRGVGKALRAKALGLREEFRVEVGRLREQEDRRVGGDSVVFENELPDGTARQHFEGVRNNTKVFESMPDDLGQPFSADMRPSEVVDLFVESFGLAWGARAVKLLALRPSEFGPWRGFAFELEFESASGLAMRAVANGALIEDRLYLIVYAGALNYYFDKYLPYFEEMVESITPIG